MSSDVIRVSSQGDNILLLTSLAALIIPFGQVEEIVEKMKEKMAQREKENV